MNRTLQALGLVVLISFFASCKKDDDSVTPPRDYTVQYATEKVQIEEYLQTHYMTVDADFNVTFDTLVDTSHQSIWDQTEYPLQSIPVNVSTLVGNTDSDNIVDYTLYYISFREGAGDKPTRADDVLVSYRGELLDGTQFDYNPYPQTPFNLYTTVAVAGWREILPKFGAGTYVDEPNSPDPAHYDNYGAGIMFIPSGLAYYNSGSGLIGAYEPTIFTFKLYAVGYADTDADGVENRYEYGDDPTRDIGYTDTDGDDIPDYLDSDDDDDGFPTLQEITIPGTSNPTQYYTFDQIPVCTTLKRHLDPACRP